MVGSLVSLSYHLEQMTSSSLSHTHLFITIWLKYVFVVDAVGGCILQQHQLQKAHLNYLLENRRQDQPTARLPLYRTTDNRKRLVLLAQENRAGVGSYQA